MLSIRFVKPAVLVLMSTGMLAAVGCESGNSDPNATNRVGAADSTVNNTGTPGSSINSGPADNANNARPGGVGANQPAMPGATGINSGGAANTGSGAGNTGATGAGAPGANGGAGR